jgi:hypothetical protein
MEEMSGATTIAVDLENTCSRWTSRIGIGRIVAYAITLRPAEAL